MGARLSLAFVADQYLANLEVRAAASSIRSARGALTRLLASLPAQFVDELNHALLADRRQERLAAGASNRTVNHEWSILASALNLAVRLDQLDRSPLAGIKSLPTTARHRRRRARALSDAEIRALLDAAAHEDKRTGGFPREPLLRALILTGARWSELVAAVWADVDHARQALTLRAESTKGQEQRVIPLDPFAFAGLRLLLERQTQARGAPPRPDARVFLTQRGCAWKSDTSNFRRWLHRLLKGGTVDYQDAIGRVLHVHAMRHTFATRVLRNGTPIHVAQRLTGHKSPAMLLRVYNGLEGEGTREAILGLPRLDIPER